MKRGLRAGIYLVMGATAGVLVALAAIQLLTRTGWGMERARQFALDWVAERVHGTVTVGRVSGRGLLRGVGLHDVAITDARGRPFLRLDSARAAYNWRTLLSGQIVLDRVTLYQPHVFLEQLPGDTAWNYEYLFADTARRDPDRPERRSLVMFRQARIIRGEATVLTPVDTAGGLQPDDTARVIVERFPGGLAKLMRFRNIDAQLGRIIWESPRETGRYFEVRRAAGIGYVFRDSLELRDAQGRVAIRDSVVSLDFPRAELPASRAAIFGTVVQARGQNYYDLQVDAERFAFPDLQWISPRLPATGGGSGKLRIQSQRASRSTLWYADDMRVRTEGSSVAGTLGIVLGDTTYFTRVNLRASPLDVVLLERLLPGGVPVEGVLVGTVEIKGPLSALETSGDLRLDEAGRGAGGRAAVRWAGVLDVRRGRLGARRLDATVGSFNLALLNAIRPNLKLEGQVTGRVSASGRLASDLRLVADLRHRWPAGDTSWLVGEGTVTGGGAGRELDLRLEARPLALGELARRYPALAGLAGDAAGPIHLSGPLDRLAYDATLQTVGGPLHVAGRLARDTGGPHYTGTAELRGFRPHALLPRLPPATLYGTLRFDLAGQAAENVSGELSLLLDSALVSRVPLQQSLVRARLADGVLHLDSLTAATVAGDLTAHGSLGIVPERTGSMALALRSSAVGLLEADIFGAAASTEPEAPRLAGAVQAEGTLSGSLQQLQVTAAGDVDDLVLGPLRLGRAHGRLQGTLAGPDGMRVEFSAEADSAGAFGRLLDTASVSISRVADRTSFRLRGGNVGAEQDQLQLEGWLQRQDSGATAELTSLRLGAADAWQLAAPVAVNLLGGAVQVAPFNLQRAGEGSLAGQGTLAWDRAGEAPRPVDFSARLVAMPFADLLRALQSPAEGQGRVDATLRVTGTTGAPHLDLAVSGAGVAYNDMRLERAFLELGAADQDLELFLEAQNGSQRVLTGSGHIPLDLRFMSVDERRLDRPLQFVLTADSLPAAQVLPFLDGFRDVRGRLDGTIDVTGTTLDPALAGEVRADGVAATWGASGVRYTDLAGTFRLVSDRVVEVDARTRTLDPRAGGSDGSGSGTVRGRLDFARLSDPFFDLDFDAQQVLAARRRDVQAIVTGNVHLGGRYSAPEVTAALRVDRGTMYLDEVYRQFFVVQLDSASMFQFVDTSLVARRRVLPVSRNPFLENLSIRSAQVNVGNGSWLRSQDMDVEVEGELNVTFDRRADDLRISGNLDVVRGTYQLLYPPLQARRFRVSEGSIEFPGLPGIDPNLVITAVYKGRARNEPLDIIAEVTGSLQNPRVRLTSNEEPPISESDLASYLFFGVPTWEWGSLVGAQAGDTREALTGLGMRTFAPSLLGYASSGLQTLAQGAGLLDYVSLTAADVLPGPEGNGRPSLLAGTQLEVGRYFSSNVYVGVSQRLANASSRPALRLEWRFDPTYTLELFSEDRFARNAPGFGYNQEADMNRVYGFFLFREWGY